MLQRLPLTSIRVQAGGNDLHQQWNPKRQYALDKANSADKDNG